MSGRGSRHSQPWPGIVALCGALACTDSSGPAFTRPVFGGHYVLRSVNGDSLPAPYTPPNPADSAYPVLIAQEIVFTSDSEFVAASWMGWAYVQPSGPPRYEVFGCWVGFRFRYRTSGDTIFNRGALGPFTPPPMPPIFLVDAIGLRAPYDIGAAPSRYRYLLGPPVTLTC